MQSLSFSQSAVGGRKSHQRIPGVAAGALFRRRRYLIVQNRENALLSPVLVIHTITTLDGHCSNSPRMTAMHRDELLLLRVQGFPNASAYCIRLRRMGKCFKLVDQDRSVIVGHEVKHHARI